MKIDGRRVIVDYERGRTQKSWLPRRLGGGKGDTRRTKESRASMLARESEYGGRDDRAGSHTSYDRSRYGSRDRDTSSRHRSRSRDAKSRDRDRGDRGDRDRGDRDRHRDRYSLIVRVKCNMQIIETTVVRVIDTKKIAVGAKLKKVRGLRPKITCVSFLSCDVNYFRFPIDIYA
jgi:hypothetical protein